MIWNISKMFIPLFNNLGLGILCLVEDIPEVLIGKGNKNIHYNGSFHANEWITTLDYYDIFK